MYFQLTSYVAASVYLSDMHFHTKILKMEEHAGKTSD